MSLIKLSLADGKIAYLFLEYSFPKHFTRDTLVNNGQYRCSEVLANGINKFSKKKLDPLQDKIDDSSWSDTSGAGKV
jgi:hypothetical protein